MHTSSLTLRGGALLLATVLTSSFTLGACDDDATENVVSAALQFEAEDPLFPGFSYDTGLLPDGASVQASFSITADGAAKVVAQAIPSGSAESPTLSGTPDTGELAVGGSFGMEGRLVIDVSGLPSYDGPIPGIENVVIEFASTQPFSPFSIGTPVTTRTDIPPTRLPSIPLPGGLPGSLVLEVAEGSFMEVAATGTTACVEGNEARYAMSVERSGTLVILPLIEIDVPLLGTKTFEIPKFEVPLSLDPSTLTMRADIAAFGAKPATGDHVSATCSGAPGSGGNAAGGASSSTASGAGGAGGAGGMGKTCMSKDECDGLPCVEGICSPGGGICDANITIDQGDLDTCISMNCCDQLEACTYGYSDLDGCNACIANNGGERCDALLTCTEQSCNGWTCDMANYGTGDGCDCGCGIMDPDCADATVESCGFCDLPGSCSSTTCPGTIDPIDNTVCQ